MENLKQYLSKALTATTALACPASAAGYFPREVISQTANYTAPACCNCSFSEPLAYGIVIGIAIGAGLASGYYISTKEK